MGVRDRIKKVFGNSVPGAIQAAEARAGMDATKPFSPGEPISPYDGYSRVPRTLDYTTGYNIATRPRTHERVAFDTLKGLIEAYDVAQTCIWHRIDSIRSLDWSLVPARGYSGDTSDAIDFGMRVLEKPDGQNFFSNWLAEWLYDTLAYDAGALYRLRNRRDDVIGLRVVDGTTIAPLLDYYGNSPEDPAEAYVQYANGVPWNWLTRRDLIYSPFRSISSSPYGRAPLESILLNANTDLRFQQYFLERFTSGNIPAAFASSPESWTPQQIEDFQTLWDSFMLGDQTAKSQVKWMPPGSKIEWSNEKEFTDAFSLFLMRKTCAAYHVVPADLGFTESVNRSSGETQADVQHRVGDLPLISHIQGVLTHFLRHDLGLPVEFAFDTGQEKEDRLALAQAWGICVDKGAASPDEMREDLLGLPGDPQRPTPRFYSTTRLGPVPLLAIAGVAGRVDPETYGPAEDQPILDQPFVPPPGVVPAAGTTDAAASLAAEDAYQTKVHHELQSERQVTKEGITSSTGITSYDLVDDEEDEDELVKAELAAFRKFRKARRRQGTWRDFEFRYVGHEVGSELNREGRRTVKKSEVPGVHRGDSVTVYPLGGSPVGKATAPGKGADWPGWDLDEACAEYWSPRVSDALTGARELAEVLAGVHTDAYLIGLVSARAVTDGGTPTVGSWVPGDTDTARGLIDDLGGLDGLTEALDGVADEARSILDDVRDIAKGTTVRGRIDSRARMAVTTALTRVSGKAAQWWYRLRGIKRVRWVLDPNSSGCPVCDMNVDKGPVKLGSVFPSGDESPPAHPNCRCSTVPA